MPAAHDIYAEQLRELRRGQPLYYPEPSSEDGAVEIGDVGYTRQGAFCRLFNVAKLPNDLSQSLGVPEGFQPLDIGRILSYDAALEPGPLHSKTVFRVNADMGTGAAVVLPVDASFQFSCSSARGAILMLEGQMSRQQVFHDNRLKNYLLQHCLSWYEFARNLGVQVDFGDIMVVTECSKTAAWASVVYSQSSREFGMSFSAGGMFVPSPAGDIAFSVGLERIGPVEHRRSQRKPINHEEITNAPKDQTVFIRGYRLGSRSLYMRSIARKIMKTTSMGKQASDLASPTHRPPPSAWSPSNGDAAGSMYSSNTQRGRSFRLSESDIPRSANVSAMTPEYPDFHPAAALLAHTMESTNVQIAVVHDDEWCSAYSETTTSIIDEYARAFFEERWRKPNMYSTQVFGDSLLSLVTIAKSDNGSAFRVVAGQQGANGDNFSATLQFSEVNLLHDVPPLLQRPGQRGRSKSEPILEHSCDESGMSYSPVEDSAGSSNTTKIGSGASEQTGKDQEKRIAAQRHKRSNRSSKCIIM